MPSLQEGSGRGGRFCCGCWRVGDLELQEVLESFRLGLWGAGWPQLPLPAHSETSTEHTFAHRRSNFWARAPPSLYISGTLANCSCIEMNEPCPWLIGFTVICQEGKCSPVDELNQGHICCVALPPSRKLEDPRVPPFPLPAHPQHHDIRSYHCDCWTRTKTIVMYISAVSFDRP